MDKRALIVGINYVGTKNQLNGCVNDAVLINELLRKNWFREESPSSVRMLTDDSATTANIIDRLKWLVADAKPGAVLLFTYSGHGVQMACPNYELHQEADGLDEAICPVDFDWRKNVIRDEDLKALFADVPKGVNLTVISDSCHSGDLLRELVDPSIQPSPSPNRPRTIPIPPDIRSRAFGLLPKPRVRELRNSKEEQIGILISGCKSTQTSADAWIQPARKYHGALTWYLSQVLAGCSYDISYSELVAKVNRELAANGYEQNPQLDCAEELKNAKFLRPF